MSRKQDDSAGAARPVDLAGTVAGSVAGSVGGAVSGAKHTISDLGGFLRDQRTQARMSLRQLAAVAGVSNPYLSQVERGLRRPSAEVLQQIAKGLRISAEALYVRAGLLEQVEGSDVPLAIADDPYLSERQKRVLLDVYASFVGTETGPAEPGDPDGPDLPGTTPDDPAQG